MRLMRKIACIVIVVIAVASLAADYLAPVHYATQFRSELPNAAPSRQHWLGTDDVGRDRFSRLLYGTRISLLLAPASALLATVVAGMVGVVAGYFGGWWEKLAMAGTDLVLSLPWFFLLLSVRAVLPLNVSPMVSVMITFALLGLLGWAGAARVLCSGAKALRDSDFVLQTRALGIRGPRLLMLHMLPNLKPVLLAQFWISVPVFILTEANLGVLGLGVTEPMPSWGGLIRELETMSTGLEPWKLVPLFVLVLVVTSFQLVLGRKEVVA